MRCAERHAMVWAPLGVGGVTMEPRLDGGVPGRAGGRPRPGRCTRVEAR